MQVRVELLQQLRRDRSQREVAQRRQRYRRANASLSARVFSFTACIRIHVARVTEGRLGADVALFRGGGGTIGDDMTVPGRPVATVTGMTASAVQGVPRS
jgi:hypothetical protein